MQWTRIPSGREGVVEILLQYATETGITASLKGHLAHTAVSRKVVRQNHTRQCRKALWVMAVHGP